LNFCCKKRDEKASRNGDKRYCKIEKNGFGRAALQDLQFSLGNFVNIQTLDPRSTHGRQEFLFNFLSH